MSWTTRKVACDGRHPGFALLSSQRFAAPLLKPSLGLPTLINGVIERALALIPEARFQTAREFANEVQVAYCALMEGTHGCCRRPHEPQASSACAHTGMACAHCSRPSVRTAA